MVEMKDIPVGLDVAARRREELRSVIRMSVPVVVTTCSRMVMDIADFVMLSCLGETAQLAQAAILPAQLIMWSMIVLGFGVVTIINTFVSQSLGRKRYADTSAYAWQACYLGVAYGCVVMLLRPTLPDIIGLNTHQPAIQALELEYARIAMLTIAPTIAAEALATFFNGVHRPKVTMWSAIEANAINVVVSAVLILGLAGMPKMGIAGAAWGTLVGTIYRFVRMALVFVGPKYAAEFHSRETWRFSLEKIRGIIRVGAPQGLQWLSDVLVWTVFINVLIGRFGEVDLVATNIGWQYMRISFMPALGIGIALSALVGKAIGKGDPDQARRLTGISVTIILIYMGMLSVIYLVFRADLIALFNRDPEIVRIGSSILICAVVFQLFDGLGLTYNAALRGAGDTFWPATLFVVSHWLIVVGGGSVVVYLRPQWGSVGPWAAATGLLIFLGLALWWRWQSGAWRKIDIFGDEHHGASGEPASDLSVPVTRVED